MNEALTRGMAQSMGRAARQSSITSTSMLSMYAFPVHRSTPVYICASMSSGVASVRQLDTEPSSRASLFSRAGLFLRATKDPLIDAPECSMLQNVRWRMFDAPECSLDRLIDTPECSMRQSVRCSRMCDAPEYFRLPSGIDGRFRRPPSSSLLAATLDS